MRKYFTIILLGQLIISASSMAQEEHKHELRAAWVASVANIDWPKYDHRNKPDEQKNDLIQMLEHLSQLHMNAIFLQVRPECDALYQSAFEPWSRFLTWTQGDNPGYDPLQFALEEAHKRGIELHVWLNPYRINASTNDGGTYYHSTHIYKEHPEWALEYPDGKKILNPGRPEVMSYIGSIVRDILNNYNVDGVHFDDYFYSYNGTDNSLDSEEYALYGGQLSQGDWRRENVNRMIDTVYSVIQEVNPSIRFGASPFGIYRNGVPPGIIGLDAYSVIYCDPLAWLRNGSVDYITPQLYWPTGGSQDFETLVNWWADSVHLFDRHLYPGQGTYRLSSDPGEKKSLQWDNQLHESKYYIDLHLSKMESNPFKSTGDPVAPWTLGQIGLQIDIIRSNHEKNALGSVFFSSKDFTRVNGLADYLRDHKYTHLAVMPEMHWKAEDAPLTPQNLRIGIAGGEYVLTWDQTKTYNERIAVYVADNMTDSTEIIRDPTNLQKISFGDSVLLADLVLSANSRIVVSAISATGRESYPTAPLELDAGMPWVQLVSPADMDTVREDAFLIWSSDLTDPLYQMQVSTNKSFSNVVYNSPWITQEDIAIKPLGLEGETTYFWRVRAKEGTSGPYSGVYSFFTGFPAIPEYISPENLVQNVSTRPTFRWNTTLLTELVSVQLSQNSSFDPILAEESFPAETGYGTLVAELEKDTWYYVRLSGVNEYGTSEYGSFHTFKTTAGEIPEVELVSPANQSTLASFDHLQWETTATIGEVTFLVEVGLDEGFSSIVFRSPWTSETDFLVEELNIEGKRTYYWRVKAMSEFGEGNYSETRSFSTGYPSRPTITEPTHLSEGVYAKPVLGWTVDEDVDSVYAEFSEDSDFSSLAHSETMNATTGSSQISISLKGFTWYYCQIKARNDFGRSIFSAKKYFKTGEATAVQPSHGKKPQLEVHPSILSEGFLKVSFYAKEIDSYYLVITDPLGREILKEKVQIVSGHQSMEKYIEYELFPGRGIYFITLKNHADRVTASFIIY